MQYDAYKHTIWLVYILQHGGLHVQDEMKNERKEEEEGKKKSSKRIVKHRKFSFQNRMFWNCVRFVMIENCAQPQLTYAECVIYLDILHAD